MEWISHLCQGRLLHSGNTTHVYAVLDRREEALDVLEKHTWNRGGYTQPFILIDPMFENLWEDEEFKDLAAKAHAEMTGIRDRIS